MKNLIFILFCLLPFLSKATTYYISASGSDAAAGTSTGTAWQTITKINATTFAAGDYILFNRGDAFYGTITISQSGTSGSPITFGSYGTGTDPIITGFTTLSGWSAYNTNIQEAALSRGHIEVVLIDGTPTARGRWPNIGFYPYTVVTSQSVISDATNLPNAPTLNWAGAELVMRKSAWTLSRDSIELQSGNNLTFLAGSNWEPMTSGYGYFIQNALVTLDTMNEWYCDGTNFYLYLGGGSGGSHTVQVSTLNTLVSMDTHDYITFDSLNFQGADSLAMYIQNSGNITVQGCSFNYIGKWGIFTGYNSHDVTINDCYFNYCYSNAIRFNGANTPMYGTNNSISNTGTIMGSGAFGAGSGDFDNQGDGIVCNSPSVKIQYNSINNSGHTGIRISSTSDSILNNHVTNSGLIRNDVGGLYAYSGSAMTGSSIKGNIVSGVLGNASGMPSGTTLLGGVGIYLDYVSNISILGNSVDNTEAYDYMINGSQYVDIHDNTGYDARVAILQINERAGDRLQNLNITRNKWIAKDSLISSLDNRNHLAFMYYTDSTAMANYGISDSNYITRPVDEGSVVATYVNSTWTPRTLAGWKTFSSKDAASLSSAITTTNTANELYITSVAGGANSLTAKYEDVTGTQYNSGLVTIPAYGSVFLINIGSLYYNGKINYFIIKKGGTIFFQ